MKIHLMYNASRCRIKRLEINNNNNYKKKRKLFRNIIRKRIIRKQPKTHIYISTNHRHYLMTLTKPKTDSIRCLGIICAALAVFLIVEVMELSKILSHLILTTII